MNEILLIVLVALGVSIGVFLISRQKHKKQLASALSSWGFNVPPQPGNAYRTPDGVYVWSQTPLLRSVETLIAIDTGVSKFLSATSNKGWSLRRRPEDYDVWLLNPTSRTLEGYPALNMVDGTKIAGIAIGVQNAILSRPFLIVAYNEETFDYLTAAVRHESEHLGAFQNASTDEWAENISPYHIHPIYRLPTEFSNDFGSIAVNYKCGCGRHV